MDNKIMMQNAAIRVCVLLEKFGITATISNYQPEPVDNLRGSWYVPKVKQYGITDIIHIKMKGFGFLAITDKCEIMSGANFMINDFFTDFDIEFAEPHDFYLTDFGFKCWCDEWGENALIIGDMHTFESFLHHYDGKHVVECEIELPF